MKDRMKCHPQYQAVAIVKTACIFAGLNNLHPNPLEFIKVLVAVNDPDIVGSGIMQQLEEEGKKPEDLDWRLYILDPKEEDPIEALNLPLWLVTGTVVATEEPTVDFSVIDPCGWFGNLHAVLANLPDGLVTPEVKQLADKLLEYSRVCPEETVTLIRQALKAKGEAVKALRDGFRPAPSENGVHVVVISL